MGKDPHELDDHPIVRAFFAGRLDETASKGAETAHDVLYRHYASAAPDLPKTLQEMQPLFRAVRHGVKAHRAQETLDEILRRRIEHGDETHIMRTLGAFGPELAAFFHFFEVPWGKPLRELEAGARVWLLGCTAFALQALGRLSDSIEPRRASLVAAVAQEGWRSAARSGGNLTHTLLTLGRIAEAVPVAEQAIVYADRSGDQAQRQSRRSNLAAVHAAAGNLDIAAALFAQAEEIKKRQFPNELQLISVHGYQYGYLLLSRGDAAAVLARARSQLQLAERDLNRDMGLERISLERIGFAHLLMARTQDSLGDAQAEASFNAAVANLRKSGRTDLLPLALLARAAHWRGRTKAGDTRSIQGIRADLAEVEDIAGEEMRLHLTDLALERARLALDLSAALGVDAALAEAETTKAACLVADTGYHRRDRDLADLNARLAAT
jgi:tetratricopeptide (TPR) repeat protein